MSSHQQTRKQILIKRFRIHLPLLAHKLIECHFTNKYSNKDGLAQSRTHLLPRFRWYLITTPNYYQFFLTKVVSKNFKRSEMERARLVKLLLSSWSSSYDMIWSKLTQSSVVSGTHSMMIEFKFCLLLPTWRKRFIYNDVCAYHYSVHERESWMLITKKTTTNL